MRTIKFNDKDIKECKLALVNQKLTSLQSAFLMQHITNLEQALNEIREYINNYSWGINSLPVPLKETTIGIDILQIIDKVGDEK